VRASEAKDKTMEITLGHYLTVSAILFMLGVRNRW
jgi:hypothetical protein